MQTKSIKFTLNRRSPETARGYFPAAQAGNVVTFHSAHHDEWRIAHPRSGYPMGSAGFKRRRDALAFVERVAAARMPYAPSIDPYDFDTLPRERSEFLRAEYNSAVRMFFPSADWRWRSV